MKIKELCKEAHKTACEKGFWEYAYNLERHPSEQKQLKRRNLSEILMLIVSELGEACEALRRGQRQKNTCYDYDEKGIHQKIKGIEKTRWVKDTFEDELADAVIRIADLCEAEGIDLEWQIKQKMKYNETRPKKHNKNF